MGPRPTDHRPRASNALTRAPRLLVLALASLAGLHATTAVAGAATIDGLGPAHVGDTAAPTVSGLPSCWDPAEPVAYDWTFSGGSPDSSNSATPQFTVVGSHEMTVSVTVNGTPISDLLDPNFNLFCPISDSAGGTYPVANRSPVLVNGISPVTVTAGVKTTFSTSAFDPDGDDVVLTWDFGDGPGSSNRYTFPGAGTYPVTVTARDGLGGIATEQQDITVVASNTPPNVTGFSAPAIPGSPHARQLTATASDPDGDALTFQWDFGDGGPGGSGNPVAHAFGPDAHTVSVTAFDGRGGFDSTSQSVTTPDTAPVAAFDASPTTVVRGTPITLDATTSSDADGDALSYNWSFDGGGTATGPVVTTSFGTLGTKTIKLTVADGYGRTDTATRFVNVVSQTPPVPSFAFAPVTPQTGHAVTFTSTSTAGGAPISSYAWDLDDDGVYDDAGGRTVEWTFPTAGTHTVRLKVSDANFQDAKAPTTFQRVVVASPPSPTPPATTPIAPVASPATTAVPLAPSPTTPVTAASKKRPFLQPFPIVRIRGRASGSGVRLSLLSVQAPSGSKVRVVCTGRGCPKKALTVTLARGKSGVRFRKMQRRLGRGATIQISVTKTGFVGKYTRFRIRAHKAPARQDSCVDPASSKPMACPSE